MSEDQKISSEGSAPEDAPPSEVPNPPKEYVSPHIETEELTAFGALCNGTTVGSRKTDVPSGCTAAFFKS